MLPFLSIYLIKHSEGGDFYEKDDHSSSVHGRCRCCCRRKRSDCLRRFFRKHCRFFRCRFCRRFRCCFRQHHQGGRSGPHDRRCFRLRSGCYQRRYPVPEAGQCRWRCQRQAAGDHHHGRAGRCYPGCYQLYQDVRSGYYRSGGRCYHHPDAGCCR